MSFSKFIGLALFTCFLGSATSLYAQTPKGHLFIIGGGKRSDALMNQMLKVADLKNQDFIAVLPMSSEEPDSAFYYFNKQLSLLTKQPIKMFNFDKNSSQNKTLTDSLQKAKLIFISGGDQTRFMGVVRNTPIYDAIHKAYQNGSTIAGTSAGAAVMCENMITGNQKLETKYTETFDNIRYGNLEINSGLGLVKNVIIDQHFLKRSRYNRLLTGLVDFPDHLGIGIDESTAIVVSGKKVKVVGESEVILVKNPKKIIKSPKNHLVSIGSLEMSVLIEGEQFKIQ